MPRPQKQVIDYFPHMVNHGKTILILRNEFGNDGYAFWFSLLELLCKSPGQFYDYNSPSAWRLLLAETHVKEDIATSILKTLAEVEAIDSELYSQKVVWCDNLVENLEPVYDRRNTGKPEKPSLCLQKPIQEDINANNNSINDNNNPHSRVNNSRVNNKRNIKESVVTDSFNTFWNSYPKKTAKQAAIKAFNKINPDELLLEIILSSLDKFKQSEQWTKDSGQFIPFPATWLNGRRWEDEIKTEKGGLATQW